MKKLLSFVLASLFIVNVAIAAPLGIIYSDCKEPVTASSLPDYTKKAEGTNMSILGLVGFGDASIEKLAKEAGITKIKHVDKKSTNIFIFFFSETFTVYGK